MDHGLCEARSSYLAWIFSWQDERVARFTRPLFVRRGNSAGEEFLIARLIAPVNSIVIHSPPIEHLLGKNWPKTRE